MYICAHIYVKRKKPQQEQEKKPTSLQYNTKETWCVLNVHKPKTNFFYCNPVKYLCLYPNIHNCMCNLV